jgi:hypothetical protein
MAAEESEQMAVLRLLEAGRLDAEGAGRVLRALGEVGAGREEAGAAERRRVLALLERGGTTPEGAVRLLRGLGAAGLGRDGGRGAAERARVLDMVEGGRLDVDGAVQVLAALGGAEHRPPSGARLGPRGDAFGPRVEFDFGRAAERAAKVARRAAAFWSQRAEELAERASRAAAEVAPEPIGESVGQVLAGVRDMVERMARAGWGQWGPGFRFEEEVEGALPPGAPATLDLEGWNGPLSVRGVDGDRVRLVLQKTVHAPSEEDARALGQAVEAVVDPERRLVRVRRRPGGPWPGGLAVEAFVPRGVAWSGDVRTGNGPVLLEALEAERLRVETSNGPVAVRDVRGRDVSVTTSNGRVEVEGTLTGRVEVRTSNGGVVLGPSADLGGEVELRASTSNGGIEVRLPRGVAVDLDLATSNGRLDLAGLGPEAPDLGAQRGFGRTELRWQSPGWAEAPARARLVLRTSNGPIRIA